MCRRLASFVRSVMLGILVCPAAAHAHFIGNPLAIEWHFPALGTVFASETAVVGDAIEFTERALGPNVDVADHTIAFFGADGGEFVDRAFNGFVFRDVAGVLADILAVSIIAQHGYTGFGPGDITFDADTIRVDFAAVRNIGASGGNFLTLGVRFAGDLPAPATLALVALGLAVGWRRGFGKMRENHRQWAIA